MRTAMQRRLVPVPIPVMFPACVLKLVLDEKQPDTDGCSQQHNRNVNQQEQV